MLFSYLTMRNKTTLTGAKPALIAVATICALSVPYYVIAQNSNASRISIITQSPLEMKGPNPHCTTEMCEVLKERIDGAQATIDFALYGVRGQKEIVQALINAKKRGVRIRGVVDRDADGGTYYSDTDYLQTELGDVRDDRESDIEARKKYKSKKSSWEKRDKDLRSKPHCKVPDDDSQGPVQCFGGRGYSSKKKIHFKGNLMHNKFFIIDGHWVWTGSANVSDTGIGGYNANTVAVIDSEEVASLYTGEFEQMFGGLYHRDKVRYKRQHLAVKVGGEGLQLYFSPQSHAMSRVIGLINGAKESIDVMIFYLTHKEVAKELRFAQERGVQVRVILDATAAKNAYSKHEYLRNYGVKLKVESWGGKMHAKTAIIDNKHIIIGSMNWTNAGERYNDENTIILLDTPTKAARLTAFFNELWASIPGEWLYGNPLPESKYSGTSCTDGIDNDFDKKKDREEEDCG